MDVLTPLVVLVKYRPLGSLTPTRSGSPAPPNGHVPRQVPYFLRWVVDPFAAFKLLLFPIVLWANWELVAPYANPGVPNPFSQFFLLSHRVPESAPEDPRYAKGWSDLVFIAYYIVFWSCIRQTLATKISHPLAKWFGLRRESKLDRFAEQLNALIYYSVFGYWGFVRTSSRSCSSILTPQHSSSWDNFPPGGTERNIFGLVRANHVAEIAFP